MNKLFYGDNLEVLRRHVGDQSVDLVYLDPPFKSNQDYNVLFAEHGTKAAAQIKAFGDTWTWDDAAARAHEDVVERGGSVADAMRAFRTFLGTSDMMAYLAMMAPRLIELKRVMRPHAAIYLHCDPTASHYLKIVMDGVFEPENFKNEIIWKRTTTKNDYKQGATNWARVHDVILYYQKRGGSGTATFRQPFSAYSDEYVDSKYPYTDEEGRRYGLWDLTAPGSGSRGHPKYEFMGVTRYWRYAKDKMEALREEGRVIQPSKGAVPRYKRFLDEMPGIAIGDVWEDIPPINSQAQERLGYPTQKPEALLERIISASSNEGDVILDPFCGCGTAIAAAEKLKRDWIGIDITHLAIGLIKSRLRDQFGDPIQKTYLVLGEPTTLDDAEELAKTDPYQFQWWALGQVGARRDEKKGADKGIDGRLYFHDEKDGATKQVILSVKAGKLHATYVRDLRGVVEREKAEIGVLISMDEPTQQMRTEAASAGFYTAPFSGTKHPRLQLLTIAELLEKKGIDYPGTREMDVTFKRAARPKAKDEENRELF